MGFRQLIAVVVLAILAGAMAHGQVVAPSNFQIGILSPTAIRLTWTDNSTTEANYLIGYHPGTSGNFGLFPNGTLSANTTTFDAIGLAPGATYQFFVEASFQGGYHASSPTVTVTLPEFRPPSNLTAIVTSPTTINLRWSDGSTNEDGFFIGYRTDTNSSYTAFPGGTVLPNTTNFIASGLAPNTTYQFLVEAFVGTTAFADSAPLTVTTPSFRPPSNVTAIATSSTTVNLTWGDATTNETGFSIAFRVGTSTNNPFYLFPGGVVAADTTNFVATGLLAGTTYQFFVEAFVGSTTFADSTPVTVSTPNAIVNRPFASAVVGQMFLLSLAASTNGGAPDFYNVTGTLPPGVNFDGINQISGTPTAGGVFDSVLTAHYASGTVITNPLTVRVIYPPAAPFVTTSNITLQLTTNGLAQTFPLSPYFSDPDTETAVRFKTSKGDFDVALYPTATPATVSNFLGYVDRNDYSNSIVHRAALNFVVQGGGFTNVGTNFGLIPTQPSPTNEPGVQHSRGTIAMAKLGSDPNSATDQWFVNLRDNGDQLDDQNGGFTAFGRVLGTGMNVLDTINGLPRGIYTNSVISGTNVSLTAFDDVPIDDDSAPATLDPTKLVIVQSVTRVPSLSYSVTSNSAPSLISAFASGTQLVLTPVTQLGGIVQIVVTATDLDGNTTALPVSVSIQSPYTTWLTTNALTGTDTLPGADPDGDSLPNAVEFALMGSPTNADASSVYATVSKVTVTNETFLAATFRLRQDLGNATVSIEGADAVPSATWTPIWTSNDVGSPQVYERTSQGENWLITIRDNIPISPNKPSRFLRLRVQVPQ